MKKLVLVVVVLGLAVTFVPVAAQKLNYTPGTSITFRDLAEDGIRSDGAAYVHGQGGVEIKVFAYVDKGVVKGSGDATLNLNFTRPARWMAFDFSRRTFLLPGASSPTGAVEAQAFLNVNQVWQVPVGEIDVARAANFYTGSWQVQFGSNKTFPSLGSTHVLVSRPTRGTWVVTTDAGALASYITKVGKTQQEIAHYELPFAIDIVCELCEESGVRAP
jgi:hypothetical protein